MKPVIAILCREVAADMPLRPRISGAYIPYLDTVQEAGGIPVIFPILKDKSSIREVLKLSHGVLLTGGEDVDPYFYGEDRLNPKGEVGGMMAPCRERDEFELKVLEVAWEWRMPIVGICRGSQLLAVSRGGRLCQDIESEMGKEGHFALPKGTTDPSILEKITHKIKIKRESHLFEALKTEEIGVNSFHHQAVKEAGKGMEVVAVSEDGVTEGIEGVDKAHFVVGTVWHPELLWKRTERSWINLFKDFVDAALAYKRQS